MTRDNIVAALIALIMTLPAAFVGVAILMHGGFE